MQSAAERVTFPSRRGSRLVGVFRRGAEDAAPVVILCHGMESTKEGTKQRRLGERLHAAGLHVLGFDFSYVGESEGEFADLTFRGEVEDLGGAWDFASGRLGGPIGLLGSSMGGTVALLFAAAEPRVSALATIAAVARPQRLLAELRPAEIERWRREGIFSLGGVKLRRAFLDDVETLDVLAACRGVSCPALVLHGDADRVVPPADAEEIAAALAGERRLKIYAGADHRFTDPAHLEELVADCVGWMADRLRNGSA